MAVSYIRTSQLRLVFETGFDPDSQEPIFKRKTFNNIKTDATAAQLYSVAESLSGLQQHPLYKIERADQSNIESQ